MKTLIVSLVRARDRQWVLLSCSGQLKRNNLSKLILQWNIYITDHSWISYFPLTCYLFGAYFIFANISTVGSVKNLTLWSRVSVRDPRSVIRRYELSVMVLLWICYGGQGLANLNRHTTASTFMLVRPPLCTRFHEHWTCTLSRKKNYAHKGTC